MAEPRRRPDPQPQSHQNGNAALWKWLTLIPIAIALASVLWQMTRGVATIDQVREERGTSVKELQDLTAQTQRSFEAVWKNLQAIEAQLKDVVRETDRRGPRLDRIEQFEARIAILEGVHVAIGNLKTELRYLQEGQAKLEQLLTQLNDRIQRRQEEPAPGPARRLPRGFP